jgi:putative addiction module component (TIGR02574 family)
MTSEGYVDGYLAESTYDCYHGSMNVAAQEILNTALQLPDKDRADLAVSLIESLDQPFDADAQTAWAEEIRRRVAELDNGTVRPLPWEEARRIIAGRPE